MSAESPTAAASRLFAQIQDALSELVTISDDDLGVLPASLLGGLTVDLLAMRDKVELCALRSMRLFVNQGGVDKSNANGIKQWLVRNGKMSHADASRRAHVVRHLHGLKRTRSAVDGGVIGLGHMMVAAGCADTALKDLKVEEDGIKPVELYDRLDKEFAETAIRFNVPLLQRMQSQIRAVVNPPGVEREFERQCDRRELQMMREATGALNVNIKVDAASATFVEEAIRLHLPPNDRKRTFAQRANDAFVEVCKIAIDAADSKLPRKGNAVAVRVHVGIDSLSPSSQSRATVTDSGRTVPLSAARAMTNGDSVLQRILTEPASGNPLDIGTAAQLFPPNIRVAVAAKFGNCQWEEGCSVPVAACDISMKTPWWRGGVDDMANAIPLCWHHHLLKENRYVLDYYRKSFEARAQERAA
ncbi:HNH endonuclease signature motif containing protein [Allonocardiopsis opalescens]|uniref:Uncharacterized protein DUF222 n=1 Tax=Allonocardiopsis opalescens TaxID=1144618 RepID=A0A2T0QDI4_9ACTN|nr:HNH endonuclease signature motif containing protein [Allonocardiopsis opalescens]PRY01975.1 uncharacterized protein DUF222 [Allonocardiopsis opalescens]